MATAIRPIGHEDRLSIVEHLDELRNRLIVCVLTLAVAFGICAWQNGALLSAVNRPLERTTEKSTNEGRGVLGAIKATGDSVRAAAIPTAQLAERLAQPDSELPAAVRADLAARAREVRAAARTLPKVTGNKPITLGVGEPLAATLTVAFYFAFLAALPILLYQLYAFLLPAFSPRERRVALPLMGMIPVLFLIGVAFGYFLVLPAATKFLQNFNSDEFNVLLQARDYYKFAAFTMVAMGLVFQMPVGVLAVTRLGILSVDQLRAYRRYAVLVNAVIAMLLPGTDPVSMMLVFVPLLILYEISVLMAGWFGRADSRWDEDGEDDEDEVAADDDEAVAAGDPSSADTP